jgi:hypothetical protein
LAGRRWFNRRQTEDSETDSDRLLPAPGYWVAWKKASARRGHPMAPGMTLRRHVTAWEHEVPFAHALLRYHYTTRYEGAPPDPKQEQQLVSEIRLWESAATAHTTISNPER